MAASDDGRGPRAKSQGAGTRDKRRFAWGRGRRNSERRRRGREIDRRRSQVMQDLADLAAVLVLGDLRRSGGVFQYGRRQMAGEVQFVVMPTKDDRLK